MEPLDLPKRKTVWLAALAAAEASVRERPSEEYGCLYYSTWERRFVVPRPVPGLAAQEIVLHFGAPGGVLPRIADLRVEATGPVP